jgi:hypothetical protein
LSQQTIVVYSILEEKRQERDNDIVFNEEGSIYEDSTLDSVDLENYNNFNHPHIDIGEHWEKLRKIETKNVVRRSQRK